jgi:hypothetical protein
MDPASANYSTVVVWSPSVTLQLHVGQLYLGLHSHSSRAGGLLLARHITVEGQLVDHILGDHPSGAQIREEIPVREVEGVHQIARSNPRGLCAQCEGQDSLPSREVKGAWTDLPKGKESRQVRLAFERVGGARP